MKHLFLTFLLFWTANTVLAQVDSGLYYDLKRDGEGLAFSRNGDTVVFYFFTYGAHICGGVIEPVVSPSFPNDGCSFNGQRWFVGVGNLNDDENVVRGDLMITEGVNYPVGLSSRVGESLVVGEFTLIRFDEGWLMFVSRNDSDVLDSGDSLFDLDGEFTTRLFVASD